MHPLRSTPCQQTARTCQQPGEPYLLEHGRRRAHARALRPVQPPRQQLKHGGACHQRGPGVRQAAALLGQQLRDAGLEAAARLQATS